MHILAPCPQGRLVKDLVDIPSSSSSLLSHLSGRYSSGSLKSAGSRPIPNRFACTCVYNTRLYIYDCCLMAHSYCPIPIPRPIQIKCVQWTFGSVTVCEQNEHLCTILYNLFSSVSVSVSVFAQCLNMITTLVTMHFVKNAETIVVVDVPCERTFTLCTHPCRNVVASKL